MKSAFTTVGQFHFLCGEPQVSQRMTLTGGGHEISILRDTRMDARHSRASGNPATVYDGGVLGTKPRHSRAGGNPAPSGMRSAAKLDSRLRGNDGRLNDHHYAQADTFYCSTRANDPVSTGLTVRSSQHTQIRIALIAGLLTVMCTGCITQSPIEQHVYFPAAPAAPHVVHLKSFNRLHDLITPQLTWVDKIRGGFSSPFVATPAGIAYHEQHLYICDTGQGYVHNWNLLTGQASRIGVAGNVTLVTPVAVAVDDSNHVYVADASRGEVVVFDRTGKGIHRLKPDRGQSMKPVALAVRAGRVYVADIASHRILVFSSESGLLETSFGGAGNALGSFYFPMGVATTNDGQLWVADSMNSRVQRFDHAFKPLTSMGSPGDRYGDMGRPRHIDIGPDGVIFVADTEFAHVHMFDQDGRLLMLLGGPQDQPAGTPMPVGIAIARNVPPSIRALTPPTFNPNYYLFVSNTVGLHRLSLYAVGVRK